MKQTNKLLSLVLSAIIMLSIIAGVDLSAYAATESGSCGNNLTWTLNSTTKELIISGTGDMTNYTNYTDTPTCLSPWISMSSYIESVAISDGVSSIGNYAFFNCNDLTNITIGNSVTEIGVGALYGCDNLLNVTVPESVCNIEALAFYRCYSLKSITISNRVTNIGIKAFEDCSSLTSIAIPNSVSCINPYSFYGCRNLKNISIPDSVINISECAFLGCNSLENLIIPNSVKTLGDSAFNNCKSLTNIQIGNGVTNIGENTFLNCDNLKRIYFVGTFEEWNNISINSGNFGLFDADIYYNSTALSSDKNHSYDEGIIIKNATCTTNGTKKYTCKVCGKTKTEIIPATGHTYKTTTIKATTKKNGFVVTKCSLCGAVKSKSTIYYPKTISLSTTSYTYDGKEKKPTVKVVGSNGKTISSSNYTVSYASGRKNVGKYAVKITFKGNYTDTKTLYFTINPKATSISSVSAKPKGFTVKWKKQSTQVTGYQIQYSTSSKFTSPKTVTVSSYKTTSKTISKLKSKKKYYVRIRTYKTVGSTKYYSSWSNAKSVTTKK